MHAHRTHFCGELRRQHAGSSMRLAGFVHRTRDHGGVLFIDLRDESGITQLIASPDDAFAAEAAALSRETVISVTGHVVERDPAQVNSAMTTGAVEIHIEGLEVLSVAESLPFPVDDEHPVGEATRLAWRFVDLRREALHRRIRTRHRLRHPAASRGTRLHRCIHADSHMQLPRGRPRLPRAQPAATGAFLRPATGTATVQAASHSLGFRALLPDRPVLPRRGCPRRPCCRRVLPDRSRDDLRHNG